ncbi:hypothetical protein FRC01_014913, partial [Tulasnella sp. 417]
RPEEPTPLLHGPLPSENYLPRNFFPAPSTTGNLPVAPEPTLPPWMDRSYSPLSTSPFAPGAAYPGDFGAYNIDPPGFAGSSRSFGESSRSFGGPLASFVGSSTGFEGPSTSYQQHPPREYLPSGQFFEEYRNERGLEVGLRDATISQDSLPTAYPAFSYGTSSTVATEGHSTSDPRRSPWDCLPSGQLFEEDFSKKGLGFGLHGATNSLAGLPTVHHTISSGTSSAVAAETELQYGYRNYTLAFHDGSTFAPQTGPIPRDYDQSQTQAEPGILTPGFSFDIQFL